MDGASAAARLQFLTERIRRLHGGEVRLDSLPNLVGGLSSLLAKSAEQLSRMLLPRFLFEDDHRLEVTLASLDRLVVAGKRNHQTLQERAFAAGDARLRLSDLSGPQVRTFHDAIIYATPTTALRKTLAIPAAVKGKHLQNAIDYMLELETPFHRDQIYWGFARRGSTRPGFQVIDLVVVPRAAIDPIIDALQAHGLHVREVAFRSDFESHDIIQVAHYQTERDRRSRRLCLFLSMLLALGFIALAALPILANTLKSADLVAKTNNLSQTAAEMATMRSALETRLQPLTKAVTGLQDLPSAPAILKILQQELGTGVSLDRLSLRGRNIQISGTATNMAKVIEHLDRSKVLKPRSVTSNGAVGPDKRESFSIALELVTAP